MSYHAAYDPMRGLRTERHKYIRSFEARPVWVDANVDGGLSKDWFREHHPERFGQARPKEYLFDLTLDPQERNNLAASPSHGWLLHEMRAKVDTHMQAYDDPLLHGPVPAPDGARVDM